MEYLDQTLYISDLATLEGVNYVIYDDTFTNCAVRGPAVVRLAQTSASSGEVSIPNQDPTTVVIVTEAERETLPVGVVLIRNCRFDNCTFEGVSFFAASDEAEAMTATFMRNVPAGE